VLFPVVGQVNGGVVRVNSQTYDMPRHGFARTSLFRCLEHGEDSARFCLDPETAETSFPLPFRLDLTVALKPRSLSLEFTVSNPGSDILPYALGFHPAFPWPFDAGPQTAYDLRFEADEHDEVPVIAPDGLLRKEHRSIPLVESRLSLAPELFRQDALVFLNARSQSWQFVAPSGSAIEMRLQNFPHLAAWTKPGAPFLSLEAWTGHADPEGFAGDLVDKPSMILLPPSARNQHRVELAFRGPDGA
jgi:galactose mutarotase-like enzyme